MDAKEHTFEELTEIVGDIVAECSILEVYLFGSRVREDNRPDSSYSFCIVTPKGMRLFKTVGFYDKLEEALGTKVDVVSERAMSDDLSKEVLGDRNLLYEA